MKLINFDEVSRLVRIRSNIQNALSSAAQYEPKQDGTSDRAFMEGYNSCLSQHNDGSGFQVDMDGCYVATEMVAATISVLEAQYAKINAALSHLGVLETEETVSKEAQETK